MEKFNGLLNEISRYLNPKDLEDLVCHICGIEESRKPTITSGHRLFTHLRHTRRISEENVDYLKHILNAILRLDLVSLVERFEDAVDENYDTDTIKTSNTSDDAHLQDETVDNVEQTDIENRSIYDDRIASAEQLLILGISHETEGRNGEAIKSYEQAVQIADETDRNDIISKSYQHLGNVFTGMSEYKKAIEYYQKAREISPDIEGNEIEVEAYQWLAYNHIRAGQYQESIKYYNEVVELASELGDKSKKIDAYLRLGSAFSHTREFEPSQEYFIRALAVAIQLNDKGLQKEVYRNLGAVYYKSCKFDAAVKLYLKIKDISHDLGETKEKVNACLMLGDIFQELKQYEEAIESYQETLNICEKFEDKEIQAAAIQRLGTLYLTLASACCKDGGYEKAITWYEDALNIFGKEPNDHRLLYEKALTGLRATWFSLGDTETKAMESIQKAQKFAQDTNTDAVDENYDADTIKTPNTSDDAHLQGETVENVEQTDIKNRSINDDKIASAEQLLTLGIFHETEGRNEEAIKSYEQAVQIADETDRNDIRSKAFQHLGNVFTGTSEYKKAIEYYQKAREISPDLEGNEMEVEAYQWLAYNHIQAGQYQESREYYNEVVKLASQLGDKKRKINAYLGLGSAFNSTGEFESSRKYFLKALTVAEQLHDKILQKEAYKHLGAVYYKNRTFDAAVKSYFKIKEISHDLGERKEEANACLMLGDTFQELKQHEEAIESYQETLDICEELEDKEMQIVAIQRLGTLYLVCCKDCDYENVVEWYEKALNILGSQPNDHFLHVKALTGLGDEELEDKEIQAVAIQRLGTIYLTLASVCCKDNDYKNAIKWYENALNISEKEPNDHRLLYEKALTGLGTTWFSLGDTEKAMESIQKAQKFVKDTRTDSSNIDTSQEHKNSTEQTAVQDSKEGHGTHAQESLPELQASSSQERGAIEDKELENVVMFEEKEPEITGGRKRAEALVEEEACNPNRTEGHSLEELVLMEKYIKISPSYVYSRQISPKEPFTKKVANIMTENVKTLAYTTFLGKNDDKPRGNDGKFDNRDQQLFNFAKSKVFKNASTQKPAKLNINLVSYMKSIGQIGYNGVPCGTCFLVADKLVITNYHVYRMIKDERTKLGNPDLPITVQFIDYQDPEQTERIDTVDVDEERDTELENYRLDYKFLCLKQSLTERVPLGPMVRNWQLSDGLVVILGHPGTKEMQEEVCTVIGFSSMNETMRKRREECTGVHMTNAQSLQDLKWKLPNVEDCLSYDTTLFNGSSGSPVIDMNGNIVAMHTQGYQLYRMEENISNQQGNIPNHEEENISTQLNLRKYSLMEFGVQFTSIYNDMIGWGDEIAKQIFPNCNESYPMDTNCNEFDLMDVT